MSKSRKKTVGALEAERRLPNGTLRKSNGKNARSDMAISTLEREHGKAAVAGMLKTPEAAPGIPAPGLYERISAVLAAHPDLLWTSESDFAIEAYQALTSELAGWPETIEGDDAEDLLWAQLPFRQPKGTSEPTGIDKLVDLLDSYSRFVAYKRPSGQPSQFDLVIGVVDGDVLTGIKTKTIET